MKRNLYIRTSTPLFHTTRMLAIIPKMAVNPLLLQHLQQAKDEFLTTVHPVIVKVAVLPHLITIQDEKGSHHCATIAEDHDHHTHIKKDPDPRRLVTGEGHDHPLHVETLKVIIHKKMGGVSTNLEFNYVIGGGSYRPRKRSPDGSGRSHDRHKRRDTSDYR